MSTHAYKFMIYSILDISRKEFEGLSIKIKRFKINFQNVNVLY